MLKAMPAIIEADPSVLYIVLGMTHPIVLKRDGESYRFKLQNIVKDLGLQEHVIFHNRFVKEKELHNFLCAADIYVTSYLNREQLTSGTLSFAVGTGKAVVSTPYWAAEELLSEGRGKLVQFSDSSKLAEAIIEILKNDSQYYSLRRRAYEYGRARTWPKIGQAYWKLFNTKQLQALTTTKATKAVPKTISSIEVPEPSLLHLKKLTDDAGLFQHAKFTIPDRKYGYTTDDNARAVIAMTKYYAQYPEPQVLQLLDIYLSFIMNAQKSDGTVRNFMHYDRSWQKNEAESSCLGRLLWAFGTVVAQPPTEAYLSIIKDYFDNSVKHVQNLYSRGMAYSILGMVEYLRQFPGASDIKRQMELTADGLVVQYEENSYSDWQWFEDTLTYDNSILPYALFIAGMAFENEKYLDVAEKTCSFLLDNTFNGKHFSFIGCNGWYERGKTKAQFDQQPIEAVSTVMMLRAAYDATQNSRFIELQRNAFDWFLGKNDLNIPLYDFKTKGCCDGLMSGGVNFNQGAESMLSFLLSLLAIVESYTLIDKIENSEAITLQQVQLTEQAAKKQVPIKSIFAKTEPKTNQVEESI